MAHRRDEFGISPPRTGAHDMAGRVKVRHETTGEVIDVPVTYVPVAEQSGYFRVDGFRYSDTREVNKD